MGSPFHRSWRGRGLRWGATLVLAVLAGVLTAATVHRAEAARAAFGDARTVPVATTDLEAGSVVTASDVRWTPVPVGLLPDGAATEPVGRVVSQPVAAGEVVLERRLGGGEGPLALVEAGRRAVAVPLEAAPPGLGAGDRVDAFAPSTATGAGDVAGASGRARRVATAALVVTVDEDHATLAVSSAEAAAVAQAALDGAVALALVPPG